MKFLVCFVIATFVRLSDGAAGDGETITIVPYKCQSNLCATDTTCDRVTGRCVAGAVTPCDRDTHNYFCQAITGTGCNTVCTDPTLQGIKRVTNGDHCIDADRCACAEGFHGNACATKVLDIDCTTADQMTIAVNPYPMEDGTAFNGNIYVFKDRNQDLNTVITECKTEGLATASIAIGLASENLDCSYGLDDSVTAGGGLHAYVYIQQDPSVSSVSDTFIRASCMESAYLDTSATFSVLSESIDPLPSTVSTSVTTSVTMALKKKTAAGTFEAITDDVTVGDDLALILDHDNPLYVRECRVSNLESADASQAYKFRQLWLIKEWCVPKTTIPLYLLKPQHIEGVTSTAAAHGVSVDGRQGWRFEFDAFYFVEGESQNLFFDCFVCQSATPAECEPDTEPAGCDDGSTWFTYSDMSSEVGRRRRNADITGGSLQGRIAVSVTVKDTRDPQSNGGSGGSNTTLSTESECYKSTSVLLPIILLAALLLVTMVMTFFFCMKVTRSQEALQTMGHENMSYKS